MSHSLFKKMEKKLAVIPPHVSSMDVHYYFPNLALIAKSF
jgi:hypothetical protein